MPTNQRGVTALEIQGEYSMKFLLFFEIDEKFSYD